MPSSQPEPVISTSVLLSLYNELSDRRPLFERGLAAHGIRVHELQDFQQFISLRKFVRMFEWLAAEMNDTALGIRLSQRAGPDALGAVGYLFLSSGNLEAALQSLQRYLEAVQKSTAVDIAYYDKFVEVRYRIVDDSIAPRRQDSEYSLGIIWRYMCLLSQNHARLTQVSFEHNGPGTGDNVYRRIFGAPVLFGRSNNALIIQRHEVSRWYDGLDPHLFPILENHIANTIVNSARPPTFRDSVLRLLTESTLQQGARASSVAAMLRISPATLHRRLRAQNCRFKALVDQRSREVAERLLRDSSMPISVISGRAGYSDPAAFCRAFRRWHNVSPKEFRHELRDASEISPD